MNTSAIEGRFPGAEENRLRQAAEILLNGRRGAPIAELPAQLRPRSIEESYFIQDVMAQALGAIGGWKVGGSAGSDPIFAPMPLDGIGANDSLLVSAHPRLRAVEAEIVFLIGEDLPPRVQPYTRAEIVSAIASCHPAIEILESAFADPDDVDRDSMIADLIVHGGFVAGPVFRDWQNFDFAQESVVVAVDGFIRVEAQAGNPTAGGLVRLVEWLANEGSARTGGLTAGQWITTGSWTGKTFATEGSIVTAEFENAGKVSLRFV